MHRAFHVERRHVATNLCPCDGCEQANNLKLKFVAHVGDVATQTIKRRRKLVGIDVIFVHRLLKNPVEVPEYVLFSEELYRTGDAALPDHVQEVSQELEGIGPVRSYFVDVGDLAGSSPPLPDPSWPGRLGRTLAVAGSGLPYMVGLRRRRRTASAPESKPPERREGGSCGPPFAVFLPTAASSGPGLLLRNAIHVLPRMVDAVRQAARPQGAPPVGVTRRSSSVVVPPGCAARRSGPCRRSADADHHGLDLLLAELRDEIVPAACPGRSPRRRHSGRSS